MTNRELRRQNMRRIVEMLRASVMDTASIAREIGVASTTVREMLLDLQDEGAVFFQTTPTPTGTACKRVWTAGAASAERMDEWDGIRRTTVKAWAPVTRRDPMVAALFGEVAHG